MKSLTPICRAAEIADISQIKSLMEQIFGLHPNLEDLFTKWILKPEYSVSVAEWNQEIIGVSTWAIKTDFDLSKYFCFGIDAIQKMQNKKLASVFHRLIFWNGNATGLVGSTLNQIKGILFDSSC